jgi:predicted glutamine amidotransferase
MCGLVGAVTKWQNGFSKLAMDAFHNLLFIDTLRGDDSTGMFMVDNKGEVEVIKEATQAGVFQSHKYYEDIMRAGFARGRFMIGHNRKATRGIINDENAHPFIVDDKIILVHNGTLWGDHKKLADTEVDSHAVAHVLSENSKDVQAAISQIEGAYALMWYNVETESMHFLRNSQRPMFYVETNDAFLWSSEESMLAFVLMRNNITPVGKITPLEENVMCVMSHNSNGALQVDNQKVSPHVYKQPETSKIGWNGAKWPGYDYESCEMPSARYEREDAEFRRLDRRINNNNLTVISPPAETAQKARYSKLYYAEEDLAQLYGCGITQVRSTILIQTYKGGSDQAIRVQDFNYVNEVDDKQGYFIYGTLMEDPSIMTRTYVPTETPANDILNWTVNEKVAMVHLGSGAWREFSKEEKSLPYRGYIIFYGQRLRIPTSDELASIEKSLGSYAN